MFAILIEKYYLLKAFFLPVRREGGKRFISIHEPSSELKIFLTAFPSYRQNTNLFELANFAPHLATMVYLTRLEHFNAAHKLFNPGWSVEQNEQAFGKCANENWHGHNYELYVTVKGDPDPNTGFVFDVKQLSLTIKDQVIEKVDHKNLNMDVDFMRGKMCSTENLAIGIWNELAKHLPASVQLHCIKLYETPRIYVEYFGD